MIEDMDNFYEESEIQKLEGEIVDLKFQLKQSKDKEMVYLDILTNIDISLKQLEQQQKETERFRFEEIDYKLCFENLRLAMNEYKRVYKITL